MTLAAEAAGPPGGPGEPKEGDAHVAWDSSVRPGGLADARLLLLLHPKVAIKCRNPPLMPAGLRDGTRLSWSEPTNEGDDDSGGPAHLSPPLWLTTQNVFYCQMSVFTCVCVCVCGSERVCGCDCMAVMLSTIIFPSPKMVLENCEIVESVYFYPEEEPLPRPQLFAFDCSAGLVKSAVASGCQKNKVCRRSREIGLDV